MSVLRFLLGSPTSAVTAAADGQSSSVSAADSSFGPFTFYDPAQLEIKDSQVPAVGKGAFLKEGVKNVYLRVKGDFQQSEQAADEWCGQEEGRYKTRSYVDETDGDVSVLVVRNGAALVRTLTPEERDSAPHRSTCASMRKYATLNASTISTL